MANKPYSLSGEPTISTVEQIDEMFELLFRETANAQHPVLGASHSDATAAAVTRGGLIVGVGDTPTWARLPVGAAATVLRTDGVDVAWSKVILTTDVSGTLPATNGGTGHASYAVGDVLYASTTTALSKLAGVATGNALISGGVGTAPSWGKIGLTTHVTGTLPAASGGTGQSTYAQGDILYGNSLGALSKLAKNVNNSRFLSNQGLGNEPFWSQVSLQTGIIDILPMANFLQAGGASRLLGRGSASGGGNFEQITLGAGLTMTGTVLDAAAGALSRVGTSTYSTTQHLMNFALSSGRSSGGAITASGTANAVDVAAGTGFVRATDSDVATLSFFDWTASTALSVPSNTTRYIGVEYNGGSPQVVARSSDTWDLDTEFPLGVVVNEGGTRYIANLPWITADNTANIIERFDSDTPIGRDNRVGGLILSNSGTRNVAVTAGTLLGRMSEFSVAALDTATAGSFDVYYRDGAGGFTKVSAQTQVNNTNYDDGDGTLGVMAPLTFSSRWFYAMTDGSIAMVYGRENLSSLSLSLNEAPPSSLPDRLSKMGVLIGRFIYMASGASPSSTQSAFGTTFTNATVSNHNDLASLQGGIAGEYYHLTAAQHTALGTVAAHATSHQSGGSDAIKLDDLAAPDDNTDLNASTTAHGLLKKLSNVSTEFMNGQGNWATPAGSGGGEATEQTTTATGTQNDFSLSASYTYLRCNNASALVFTGFTISGVAPTAGDMVIIDNIGSSSVRVAHQDTGSTAANRAIWPSTRGQIVGAGGRLWLIYDATTERWRGGLIETGSAITVAYSAGDFTASGAMTWTVDASDLYHFSYQQRGTSLIISCTVIVSTTGGVASSQLRVALPNSFVSAGAYEWPTTLFDNGTLEVGRIVIAPAGSYLSVQRIPGSNWTLCTDNAGIVVTPMIFTVT